MKSLAFCLKKAGKILSSKDAVFIKDARDEYIADEMPILQATQKAINDFHRGLLDDADQLSEEVEKAGGYIPKTLFSLKKTGRDKYKWSESVRDNGMPHYQGSGFHLEPVQKFNTDTDFEDNGEFIFPLGHAEHVVDNNEAYAFVIRDASKKDVGSMVLQIDPKSDTIVGIHDFYISRKKKGTGGAILNQILANSNSPVKIYEMIDEAWGFWQNAGVEKRHPFNKSGELTYEQYQKAQQKRRLEDTTKNQDQKQGKVNETDTDNNKNDPELAERGEVDLTQEQVPGEEDSWMYRLDSEPDVFEKPKELTHFERAILYIQDKFLPLKKIQDSITKSGAIITDKMNAYVKETLMHKKASNDLKHLKDDFLQPISDLLSKSKITLKMLDLFLYAKHAKERNAMISDRYHTEEIREEITLSGGDPVTPPEAGSGMTNAEASAIVNEFRSEGFLPDLEKLSSYVYKMLEGKNERLNKAGTLSDSQHQSWSKMFKNYVPLKGFQENQDNGENIVIGRVGKGFSIKGRESMQALGRRSMSASPLINAIQDSTSAILRARKNEVAISFYELVKANPNPAYWSIHTKEDPGTKVGLNPDTGKVERHKLQLHQMSEKNGYMGVKIKGEQIFIKIEDLRLEKAMLNLGADTMSPVIKFMAKGTRLLSALNTSLNPEFMMGNFPRDIQTAVFNALSETDSKGGKLQGKFKTDKEKMAFVAKIVNPKTIMKSMRGINNGIKTPHSKGKWEAYYRDFREQGAESGFFDMKTNDQIVDDMKNMMQMAQGGFVGNTKKAIQGAGEFIERINVSVENAVRLSAYVNSIDAGLTKQQAANFAKNLTVNFNRKGEITWLNAIYMFGNASVQGTAQFARSVLSNPLNHPSGKTKLTLAQKAAVTMSAAGYLFSMMGRELGGEDEDGEKWIDKVPDYVQERNLVIMKSILGGPEDGSYWSIPLPYGYNIFHNIGSALEQVGNGSKRKDLSWASRFVTFSALGSFSPVGMNTSEKGLETALLKTGTPTLFKPFAEMGFDENFFGSPIYRDNRYDKTPKPDSQGKERTGSHWKAVSTFLNQISGGSDFKPGLVDIAPESFQHLITSYAGGLGRLGDNLVSVTGDVIEGNEIEDRKKPFYRKVSGKISQYSNVSDFYDRKDEVNQAIEEFKSLKGKNKIFFRRENKDILSLNGITRATDKKLRALRRRKKMILKQNHPNKKLHLARVELQIKQTINRFNRKYNDLFN